MKHGKLKIFRTALEKTLAELSNGKASHEGLIIESSPDELDRIQHASNREFALGKLERDFNRLREVRAALHRMDIGEYGVCTSCNEDINARRLTAIPWANTCIMCQQSAELIHESLRDEVEVVELTAV